MLDHHWYGGDHAKRLQREREGMIGTQNSRTLGHTESIVIVQLGLTRIVAHSGNGGEGLALRGHTVLLEVETLQQ